MKGIIIEFCDQCPHRKRKDTEEVQRIPHCAKAGRDLPFHTRQCLGGETVAFISYLEGTPPDWCPLPDVQLIAK